jgi:hypothetical protein
MLLPARPASLNKEKKIVERALWPMSLAREPLALTAVVEFSALNFLEIVLRQHAEDQIGYSSPSITTLLYSVHT